MAGRPRLPALRRRGPYLQDQAEPGQAHPHGPSQVRRLRQAVHRQGCTVSSTAVSRCTSSYRRCTSWPAKSRLLVAPHLEVQYRTMVSSRIASTSMRDGSLAPMGGNGATVEADDLFRPHGHSAPVVTAQGSPPLKRSAISTSARSSPGRARRFCPRSMWTTPTSHRAEDHRGKHRPRNAAQH